MSWFRKVILESPYSGDIERNVTYARRCLRDCLLRGESAIASHLLYTQPDVLRDEVPEERELGIAAGHAWIMRCDMVVVYTDYGISRGMQTGIDSAVRWKIPVQIRSIGVNPPCPSSQPTSSPHRPRSR